MKNIDWDKEFPEVPQVVHTAVLNALESLGKSRNRKVKRLNRKKILILVAALCVVSGMTVAAAELVKWNQRTVEKFGQPPEKVQEKLAAEGIAKEQKVSVTDQGITVTAVQTMQDEQRVYILLDVCTDEAIIDPNSLFLSENLPLITQDPDAFQSIGCNFTTDLQERVTVNRGYYEIDALKTTGKGWNADSVTVSFNQFSYYTYDEEGKDTIHYIDGNWELKLPLNNASEYTGRFEINRTFSLSGIPVRLNSIALSPLSIELHYNLEDTLTLEDAVYQGEQDNFMQELFVTGFMDGEGNEINCGFGGSGGNYDFENNENILVIALGTAVDPQSITAVLLGNEKIRVELK